MIINSEINQCEMNLKMLNLKYFKICPVTFFTIKSNCPWKERKSNSISVYGMSEKVEKTKIYDFYAF